MFVLLLCRNNIQKSAILWCSNYTTVIHRRMQSGLPQWLSTADKPPNLFHRFSLWSHFMCRCSHVTLSWIFIRDLSLNVIQLINHKLKLTVTNIHKQAHERCTYTPQTKFYLNFLKFCFLWSSQKLSSLNWKNLSDLHKFNTVLSFKLSLVFLKYMSVLCI